MEVDYKSYKKQHFSCPQCGWKGEGEELSHGEFSEEHFIGELNCPACFNTIAFWQAPLIDKQKETENNIINTPESLLAELNRLHQKRKQEKIKRPRGKVLTTKERQIILDKTNSKCHICGCDLDSNHFETDHVKAHIGGGSNELDNYLPSCRICNNYRWNYLPEEIQWIFKIGVWAKTQILSQTAIGKKIAPGFISHELRRIKRNKKRAADD